MAVDMDTDDGYELKDLKHSLRTASLELNLERSKHSVEMVAKEEDIRKLQVGQCLLQDENSDLHEQLEEEQTRSDVLEAELNEALAQLDDQTAAAEVAQNQIRTQTREIANLKAELKAMENVTSDSNKILSEKLALARELSSLRPEVEHLRAQVETNNGLLAEKLSLERQLNTAQVELENEKRTSARALAKQGKKMEQDEDLRSRLEELRNELTKEKKERIKAEAAVAKAEEATEQVQAELDAQQQAMEKAQAKLDKQGKKEAQKASKRDEEHDAQMEQLRQELAEEKSARAQAEKASGEQSEHNAQIEALQQQLAEEKRERQKLDKASKKASQQITDEADSNAEELRKELEAEKRERKRQEKEYTKTLSELQSKNTILDDKLSAFREKLRSTKATLKQKEEELEHASRAQTAPPTKPLREPSVKPVRKRMAASVEPETALGTPGHEFPSKKTKRGISAIGDTSNFSLTPFLNRTAAPGEPTIMEAPSDEEDAAAAGAQESTATPTGPPKKETKAKPRLKALVPSASNKANAKPGARKKAPTPILDVVAEEASQLSSKDNSENLPAVTVPLKTADGPSKPKTTGLVPKIKPRKSLMSFATFMDEPAAEKKKKRKLGASGLGKTLFDDDDEEEEAAPKKTGKGIFAARAIGGFGKKGLGGRPPISGGFNAMSDEGFTFSPLKKDRRAAGGAGASFLK